MTVDRLVKMANQIGNFFEAWPDPGAARHEVANHLRRFWDPRMRNALIAHMESSGDSSGLTALVTEAVVTLSGRSA